MQWEIVSQVGDYFMDHLMTSSASKIFRSLPGDPIETSEFKLADQKLDNGLKRIIRHKSRRITEFSPEVQQRWGYATAALAIFDEIQGKKDDMSIYKLEMRKMILEGSNNTTPRTTQFGQEVMKTTNRDQLVTTLLRYINAE